MTARWDAGLDHELEAGLFDLGAAIAPQPAPGLAGAVRRRVESRPVPGASASRLGARLGGWADGRVGGRRPLRRGLVLALVALLVVAGLATAIGFGLPGLRIVILGPAPSGTLHSTATSQPSAGASPVAPGSVMPSVAPTAPPLDSLGLGRRVDPAGLDAAAGRHVPVASLPELGAPLAAFVRGTPPDAIVTLAYGPTATIPAGSLAPVDAGAPVVVLVTELPGTIDGAYLQKLLPAGTTIDSVRVGGHEGFWIAGAPHELLYIAPNGDVIDEPARLAGNVLAWNDGELTFRIEGAPNLATAQRIAASLH